MFNFPKPINMPDTLLPEFFEAMGAFRHALEKLSSATDKKYQPKQQLIVTQIMGNMLDEAYVKIAQCIGDIELPNIPHIKPAENTYASVITVTGRALQSIIVKTLVHAKPEGLVTLVDDGISFQALLELGDDRAKKIYDSE